MKSSFYEFFWNARYLWWAMLSLLLGLLLFASIARLIPPARKTLLIVAALFSLGFTVFAWVRLISATPGGFRGELAFLALPVLVVYLFAELVQKGIKKALIHNFPRPRIAPFESFNTVGDIVRSYVRYLLALTLGIGLGMALGYGVWYFFYRV